MSTISELRKITNEYKEYENEYGFSYKDSNYRKLRKFLEKKLLKSPFKKIHARVILDNFDLVLKYTNATNIEWTSYNSILSQPDFLDKLLYYLPAFRFNEHIPELLVNHIYTWLKASFPNKADNFFSTEMINYIAGLELPNKSCTVFFNNMKEDEQYYYLNLLVEKKIPIPFGCFDLKEKCKKFLCDNVLYIASDTDDLFLLRESVFDDNKALNDINNYIDENKEKSLESLCKHLRIMDDDIKSIIKLVISDVLKNENASLSDIVFDSGYFSDVLIIRDKVIKIGHKRENFNFKNNPYIVKPLFRKCLKTGKDRCYVEVTERVDNHINVSEDEMYELYKNVRNLHLIWTDVATRNVGRLIKDNIIHWNEQINPSDKDLSFTGSVGDILLKKGDLVILDADFIYNEDDKNIDYPEQSDVKYFEEKYRSNKTK